VAVIPLQIVALRRIRLPAIGFSPALDPLNFEVTEKRAGATDVHQILRVVAEGPNVVKTLDIDAPPGRILYSLEEGTGWQWQDMRRNQDWRGKYRFVIPFGITRGLKQTVRLTASLAPVAGRLGRAPGLGAQFAAADLRPVMNVGWRDDIEGDRKGGWTDQGDNDLRSFPTGLQYFCGIPFEIVSPDGNRGLSVLVLGGAARTYFPITRGVKPVLARTFTKVRVEQTTQRSLRRQV
jgi:hypothetical protein